MDNAQYRHVEAALTMQEFLLRVVLDNLTAKFSAKGLDDFRRDIEKGLKVLHLPSGVEPDEETLAIQREALRQFDVFWKRLVAPRGGTPPA